MFAGTKIKELRDKKAISRDTMAADLFSQFGLRVTGQTISNWEGGEHEPDASKVKILAEYFGVTMDFFFNGESPNQVGI